MKMLDLCAGLGGASAAMVDRRWRVVTLDNDPRFNTSLIGDVRTFPAHWLRETYDLIWASPPCTEFSREFMPWCKTGNPPDMSIVDACFRLIDAAKPRYWVVENVIGAVKWFTPQYGKYKCHYGPYYLWGEFPPIGELLDMKRRNKESMSSSWDAERAKIPYELSMAFALAIEAAAS